MHFRTAAKCYRQEAHKKDRTWQVLIDNDLPERISSWTTSVVAARNLKGGVPPEGLRGVIFVIEPTADQVILNLDRIYGDAAFQKAIRDHQKDIFRFGDGIGRYANSQREVILETDRLSRSNILSYGGFAGDLDHLKSAWKEERGYPPNRSQANRLRKFVNSAVWLPHRETLAVINRTEGKLIDLHRILVGKVRS